METVLQFEPLWGNPSVDYDNDHNDHNDDNDHHKQTNTCGTAPGGSKSCWLVPWGLVSDSWGTTGNPEDLQMPDDLFTNTLDVDQCCFRPVHLGDIVTQFVFNYQKLDDPIHLCPQAEVTWRYYTYENQIQHKHKHKLATYHMEIKADTKWTLWVNEKNLTCVAVSAPPWPIPYIRQGFISSKLPKIF